MPKNYKHRKYIKDDYVNWCINIEAKKYMEKNRLTPCSRNSLLAFYKIGKAPLTI